VSGPFSESGTPAPGATAEEVAAEMAADPWWEFASDPVKAVAHATGRHADAVTRGLSGARLWADVRRLLVEAADSPYVH
jgi:hypothetical protein